LYDDWELDDEDDDEESEAATLLVVVGLPLVVRDG